MDYGSGITKMAEERVRVVRGQLGITQSASAQAVVGQARVRTALVEDWGFGTQSCTFYVTIDMSWVL